MTREEAIKVLKEYLALDKDIDNEYLEAQKVAIKALEEQANPNSIRINFVGEEEAKEFEEYLKNQQEPILDKIMADIQKLRGCSCWCSDGIIDDVEDIIDKYKAESEDKE